MNKDFADWMAKTQMVRDIQVLFKLGKRQVAGLGSVEQSSRPRF